MMLFRPILPRDREAIITLSFIASEGLSSMPKDRKFLNRRIDQALATWQNPKALKPHERLFLFAFESPTHLVGFSAIRSCIGAGHFVLKMPTQPEQPLEWTELEPSYSELCSLFLNATARHNGMGKALSFGRLFYLRHHRQWFHNKVLAQLRGWILRSGHCPFWTSLALLSGNKKAKSFDFATAHHLVATHAYKPCDLITEPLPLLGNFPETIQKVIAHAHEQTIPAEYILKELGFYKLNTMDPLDAGPHYAIDVDKISLFKHILPCYIEYAHDNNHRELAQWLMLYPVFKNEEDSFEIYVVKGHLDKQHRVVTIKQPAPNRLFQGSLVEAFDLDSLRHTSLLEEGKL